MFQRAMSKEEVWRLRVQRFLQSGLTVVAFCRREGVSTPSFYLWRKRLGLQPRPATAQRRPPRPPLAFLPVTLRAAGVEVLLPNGARVLLPPGDADALRVAIEAAGRLLPALEGKPC